MARIFNPNQKMTGSAGAALIVAILLVFNTLLNVSTLPYLDVHPQKIHTLSRVTLDTLQKIDPLEPPIRIDFYYTPDVVGLPREVQEAGKEVLRLLSLYQNAAGSRVEVQYFQPDPLSEDDDDLAVVREAHNKGIRRFENYWNQKTLIVYCGLVFSRGKKSAVFDQISAELLPQLEFKMTSAIAECIQSEQKILGLISGLDFQSKQLGQDEDGKPKIIPEWQILTRLKKEFQVRFLTHPAQEISGCDVLMVIQPRGLKMEDYQAIEQHVLQGKGALFCESPFSFQELILMSRDQQVLNHQLSELLQQEAQNAAEKAEQEFEEALKMFPEAKAAWKNLQSVQERMQKAETEMEQQQAEMMAQEAMRGFQMQVFTKQEVMESFNQFREKMEQANMMARGMARPPYGSKAFTMMETIEKKAGEALPPGREINQRLFQTWGVQLLPQKLLFIPVSKGEEANITQFNFPIGNATDHDRYFAKNRLETQHLESIYVSFCGVFERFGEYSNPVYHSLIRVDKQFSFFVPGEKTKKLDWFAVESFEKFLSFNPKKGGRQGDRFEEWQKALETRGDQLSGWFDVAVALEGEFTGALPQVHLMSLKVEPSGKFSALFGELDQKTISDILRQEFEAKKITLGKDLVIEVTEAGKKWLLLDKEHQRHYLLTKQTQLIKTEKETEEETQLSIHLKSSLPRTQAGATSRVVLIASVDMLELNPATEEQRERQQNNHNFILGVLKNLSLDPEIATLSHIGSKSRRFDVLDELVQVAEKEAKTNRKLLEEDREKKRTQAKEKYAEAMKQFPSKRQTLSFGGLFTIDAGEYIPDEQRVAMEMAEQELEDALESLKREEKKTIEMIEYKVSNATKLKKSDVRFWGTLTSPLLILLMGLLAFYWIQNSRRS